ncbi:DUF3995 domain-containing protein [uncultured Bartonella sp.]|uniref:DUF3995 domain-containing protein n=1 Tax=uncultured Bartonella sp. TaxID=104108 RepID=UPI002611876A|nr:DUF3995 domain-containing protein [uncultured Bartonella sp.]
MPGVFVVSLMLILSLVHFYWAVVPNSLPSTKVIFYFEGKPALHPTRLTTCVVAFFWCSLPFLRLNWLSLFINFPSGVLKLGKTTLTFVFAMRALGDFRLVSFVKSIKDSEFALYDTRFHSPLCLTSGILF